MIDKLDSFFYRSQPQMNTRTMMGLQIVPPEMLQPEEDDTQTQKRLSLASLDDANFGYGCDEPTKDIDFSHPVPRPPLATDTQETASIDELEKYLHSVRHDFPSNKLILLIFTAALVFTVAIPHLR